MSAADTGRLEVEMRMPRSSFSRSNSSRVPSRLISRGVARIGTLVSAEALVTVFTLAPAAHPTPRIVGGVEDF